MPPSIARRRRRQRKYGDDCTLPRTIDHQARGLWKNFAKDPSESIEWSTASLAVEITQKRRIASSYRAMPPCNATGGTMTSRDQLVRAVIADPEANEPRQAFASWGVARGDLQGELA